MGTSIFLFNCIDAAFRRLYKPIKKVDTDVPTFNYFVLLSIIC